MTITHVCVSLSISIINCLVFDVIQCMRRLTMHACLMYQCFVVFLPRVCYVFYVAPRQFRLTAHYHRVTLTTPPVLLTPVTFTHTSSANNIFGHRHYASNRYCSLYLRTHTSIVYLNAMRDIVLLY